MFRQFLIPILILLSSSAYAFDRQALHEQRLSGLKLDLRGSQSELLLPSFGSSSTSIAGDISISESVAPSRFTQDRVSLASLSTGEWLALWQDERTGSSKLFLQRIDAAGLMVGSNQLIAGSATGARYVDPIIRVDSLDRVYVFYRDQTNGLVFGSRLLSDLSVDIATFLVNDTAGQAFAGPFDLAVTSAGRMVVAWENSAASGQTIEYRIYDPSGISVSGPATAHSDLAAANRWVPSVATSGSGDFVIAWEDYRTGVADIYARQFAGSGVAIGPDIAIVGPPENLSNQFAPRVSALVGGMFVVAWIDQRVAQEIYLQRFDIAAGPVGGNILASDGDSLSSKWDVELLSDNISSIQAFWGKIGNPGLIIRRTFDSTLSSLAAITAVNQSSAGQRWGPAAALSQAGETGVAWVDVVDNPDIHFTTINNPPAAGELSLNDDAIGAPSTEPSVIAIANWRNLVAFRDQRRDAGDIYFQVVDNAGVLDGLNQRVDQDGGSAVQAEPSLAVSGTQALVVWVDSRDMPGRSGQRIFGRFSNLSGQLSGNEFVVSDSGQLAVKRSPVAVMSVTGAGLVVWLDERGGSPQVYGKWLDIGGALSGSELLFSNPAVDQQIVDLRIDADGSGNVYLLWLDSGGASNVLRMRSFRPDRSALSSFDWSPTLAGVTLLDATASVMTSGEVMVAWTGSDGISRNLYLSQLSITGTEIGTPRLINDNASAAPLEPRLSVSNNDYTAITWIDNRDGRPLIYYQVLNVSLSPILANQPVAASAVEFMQSPAIHASDGRAWFSWVDNRANGLNVQASVVIYEPTDVDDGDGDGGILPGSYNLAQNYPNPFNPSTVIEYSLPKRSQVRMEIFDILGKRVQVLVDSWQPAGEHTVTWNGRSEAGVKVASGVYFYRMSSDGFTSRRKMILLK